MPPKSSSKKSVALWYYCDNCRAHVTSKDHENHEKVCPLDSGNLRDSFVLDKVLFSTTVNLLIQTDEIKDIPKRMLKNVVFISESAMKLCNFVIGENVEISCPNRVVKPMIRIVWPLPEHYLSTVHVSSEDYENYWDKLKGFQIRIKTLKSDPVPATEILLGCVENYTLLKSQDAQEELTNLIQHTLKGFIFCTGAEAIVDFYNKKVKLIIKSGKPSITPPGDSLESKLEALHIEESNLKRFYLITGSTRLILQQEQEAGTETEKEFYRLALSDIGGLDETIESIQEMARLALGYSKSFPGVKISRGVLLFGPTGCGKTMLCSALANTLPANVMWINTSAIFSRYFGETEKNLQKYFERAFSNYPSPSLLIVEDLNNICPKNETNEVVQRVSAAFLTLLDSLTFKKEASRTFLIATTNDLEMINPAVRRYGRFDSELEISAPSPLARKAILEKQLANVKHELSAAQIEEVSNVTHGFVGSDITNLVYKAGLKALQEGCDVVKQVDMNFALGQVKPSAMREVLIANPNVKWADIGGQIDVKLKLKQAIEWPLLYPEKLKQLGINPPRGILLFGPPGCSKTMIAKALATEGAVNFLSIKGPELFSMWVGESERAVREVFRKARQIAPCIVFFDEIDAIGGERSSDNGSSVKERVLAQMLTELDGVSELRNVTIVAATNRPDMIDKALLRPGRIDRIVYVGLPDVSTRTEIFKIKLKTIPLSENVSLDELVSKTEGYSGAEIQAICTEAAFKALEDNINAEKVAWKHFELALKIVQPRTSPKLLKFYEDYLKESGKSASTE